MYIDFSSFFDQSLRGTVGFYPAKSHEKAFLRISDGLNHHHSAFFLRGAAGVGKTHILERLYRKPEASLRKAWLSAETPDVSTIMQSFADMYDMRWDPDSPNKLRSRLVDDITNKKIPVLYIDNIISLDVTTLIKLTNILRWRKQSLAKVVFAGRFKLTSALTMFVKHNDIKAMQCKLHALDEAEVHAYLVQMSRVSGYAGRSPFDKGAIHALIKHSRGIPKKLNCLCDFCLFLARTNNLFVLDEGLIDQAAENLKKLNLCTLDDSNNASSETGSRQQKQSSSQTNTKKKTGVRSNKKLFSRFSAKKDNASQPIENQEENHSITYQWKKTVDSYFRDLPQNHSKAINLKSSREISLIRSLFACLLLSLGVGILYYLYGGQNHLNGLFPDIFQSNLTATDSRNNTLITNNSQAKPLPKIESRLIQNHNRVEPALILAVWNNRISEVKELLKLGVAVNARNHFGHTPLMVASILGNEQIVELMLENNAAINLVDNKGLTALMLAARNGQSKIVEYLLSKGAEIDTQDKRGMTAIMHASSFGHQSTVEVILKHKPELEFKNGQGQSADAIAQALGYYNIAEIIQAAL